MEFSKWTPWKYWKLIRQYRSLIKEYNETAYNFKKMYTLFQDYHEEVLAGNAISLGTIERLREIFNEPV